MTQQRWRRAARGTLLFAFLVLLAGCGASDPAVETGDEAPVGAEPDERSEQSNQSPTPVPVVDPTEAPVPEPTSAPTAVPMQETSDLTDDVVPVVFADDFATSIQPIFADHCASCHNAGGPAAAHWALDTAADLVSTHEWISQTVQSGYMPPWPSSDLSLSFHNERGLRSDEVSAIVAWSQAGAPLDVDAGVAVAAPAGVIALDADIDVAPHESYSGSPAVPDDYRCLIYELGNEEPAWMTGFEFVPDQAEIVHHAIGYLAPEWAMERARALSAEDEAGGWQCYGASGLGAGDTLFLGWAPGQLPTQYPSGAGVRVEPGAFVVLQIHYHFDTEAPADASRLRIDWSDRDDLDPIRFSEFIGPAEIPCSTSESGPLCDRDAAIARAIELYGEKGVLANGINGLCGVSPADFAHMTNGIASSSCTIPVRAFGEIVSVFGHEHEIGKSFRMTLNAGTPEELVLLDIPDWDFDWQYNYYPSESIVLEPGDDVLLECTWDRSRRAADLEPAYVLWADGTNDEMCFAMISLRQEATSDRNAPEDELALPIPPNIAACLEASGVSFEIAPLRSDLDAIVDGLFDCAEPDEVGEAFAAVIAANFEGLISDQSSACFAARFGTPGEARNLLVYSLPDATEEERMPLGELVADCVPLSEAMTSFGLPIAEDAAACVDEAGRPLLVAAAVDGQLPEAQTIFALIAPCLGN